MYCVLEILCCDGWYCTPRCVAEKCLYWMGRYVVLRFVVQCSAEENMKRERTGYCCRRFFYTVMEGKEAECYAVLYCVELKMDRAASSF